MTHTEAFSHAKDKENPDSNEDRFVTVPGRLYAVIDGATDKSGSTHDGETGGQIAGRILESVLVDLGRKRAGSEVIELSTILGHVNRRLREQYRTLGIADAVRNQPWRRFSAQAAIAIRHRDLFRFIVVGDTGLRINGHEVFSQPILGDVICAQIRSAVHRYLTGIGFSYEASDEWSREYTVEGLSAVLAGDLGKIGPTDLSELREVARRESQRRLPGIAADDIDDVLMYGLKGLHRYRNRPGPLGFPCIDGSPVPKDMTIEFERAAESIECIELFSDGYTNVPQGTAVADWEAEFWTLERDDPGRIDTHPGTKGSTAEKFADDRTVLIVRPKVGSTA